MRLKFYKHISLRLWNEGYLLEHLLDGGLSSVKGEVLDIDSCVIGMSTLRLIRLLVEESIGDGLEEERMRRRTSNSEETDQSVLGIGDYRRKRTAIETYICTRKNIRRHLLRH